jgi:hypothetical protein
VHQDKDIQELLVALLDVVADRVASRVEDRLVERGLVGATFYTTAKGGALPPGRTRRWLMRNAKLVPGARKEGRNWIVSRTDWEHFAAARDEEQVRARVQRAAARPRECAHSGVDSRAVDELADAALIAAGYRFTDGA